MQDVASKSTGDFLQASDWNTLFQEMKNIIETAGITLSGSDEFQNSKGVATYAADGDFYIDTGAVDAYVLSVTSRKGPPSYTEGMRVRFKAANSNTGASTVNLTTLGIKTIKKNASVDDLVTGDIVTGNDITLVYDSSAGFFNLEGAVNQATTTTRGIVELATQAEVNAGTDTEKAVVPDALMTAVREGKLNYVGITAGTSSAYTLNPSPAYTAYTTSMIFLVKIHADNAAAATINVNSLGAKKIFLNSLPQSNPLELQSLGTNHAYWFFYDTALDGGSGAFWAFASRFATQSEVDAGTTVSKYVSPATLAGRTATETRSGVIELATQAEVDAGSDTDRAITPATLTSVPFTNHIPIYASFSDISGSFVVYDEKGGTMAKGATGEYNFTFTSALANTNYLVIISAEDFHNETLRYENFTSKVEITTNGVSCDHVTLIVIPLP